MTFPSNIDVQFYESKQELPMWAAKLVNKRPASAIELIDVVVNAHAGRRLTNGEIAVSNLLAIVRGYRRRGENISTCLRQLAKNPECMINPEKRAAFARKWAAKLGAPHEEEFAALARRFSK